MGIQNACQYFSLGSSRMSRRIGNSKYIVFVLISTQCTYKQLFKIKLLKVKVSKYRSN